VLTCFNLGKIDVFRDQGRQTERVRNFFGEIGDRIVVDGGEAVRRVFLWPIQDRLLEYPGRVLGLLALVLLVAGATTAALLAGAPHSSKTAVAIETAAPRSPLPQVKRAAGQTAPTLHGARPAFKAAGDGSSTAAAKAASSSAAKPAAAASAPAADATISSKPKARTSTPAPAPSGPPAGPAAIAVAHQFADAFVVYETGGEKSQVRKVLAETATPQLSRSLLHRPPRLPAGMKVPKAKVLNIVAGPSQGHVYSVSVSLLRVGVTSELRLAMEPVKHEGWRVANVLG
jgi:hypothetical protein